MKALHKSIRISLAALLLLALPLLGHMYACGLAGLCGKGLEQIHQDKIEHVSGLHHTDSKTLEAASPGFIGLYKSEQNGSGQAHSLQLAGLPWTALLLRFTSGLSQTRLQVLLQTDFTPVQRLVLFPHHGFW